MREVDYAAPPSKIHATKQPLQEWCVLTKEQNDRLTQVGPGTPMGELMRRYWQPIAGVAELQKNPTKAIRLLGEDLVLYKDKRGQLGLIEASCAHRRVNLMFGSP